MPDELKLLTAEEVDRIDECLVADGPPDISRLTDTIRVLWQRAADAERERDIALSLPVILNINEQTLSDKADEAWRLRDEAITRAETAEREHRQQASEYLALSQTYREALIARDQAVVDLTHAIGRADKEMLRAEAMRAVVEAGREVNGAWTDAALTAARERLRVALAAYDKEPQP